MEEKKQKLDMSKSVFDAEVEKAKQEVADKYEKQISEWQQNHPILHAITQKKKTLAGTGIVSVLLTYFGLNPQHIPFTQQDDKVENNTELSDIGYVPVDYSDKIAENRTVLLSLENEVEGLDQRIDDRFDAHEKNPHTNAVDKFELLNQVTIINNRFTSLESDMKSLENLIDDLDDRIEKLEK